MSEEPNLERDFQETVLISLARIEAMLKQMLDQQLLPEKPERGFGN
jgi:hypothetical protein